MPVSPAIQELLASIDKDGSGKVDAKELLAALGGTGIREDDVREFIKDHDKDGDGQLNLAELTQFFESLGF